MLLDVPVPTDQVGLPNRQQGPLVAQASAGAAQTPAGGHTGTMLMEVAQPP